MTCNMRNGRLRVTGSRASGSSARLQTLHYSFIQEMRVILEQRATLPEMISQILGKRWLDLPGVCVYCFGKLKVLHGILRLVRSQVYK